MRVLLLLFLSRALAANPWQLARVARLRGAGDYEAPDGAGWEGDFDFGAQGHGYMPEAPRESAGGAFADAQHGDEATAALAAFMAATHGKVLMRVGAAIEGVLLGELLKNILGGSFCLSAEQSMA